MATRIGSFTHLAPTERSPVPGNTALAAAIALDDAMHSLGDALSHFERLGLNEGMERIRMSQAAATDAIDELHKDDPEEDEG
jgi:hypothetical protein